MPQTRLDTTDATELAELLQFLTDWLTTDPDNLAGSLTRFLGTRAYTLDQLRADLDRFAFLLGGNDGEQLFNTTPK